MQKKLWNKDFILMLQGGTVSGLGDLLYSVAIGFWVYEMTGSNTLMGVMSSISMFMSMIVMPFSGTIIDKCNRKAIIVGMDVLRGVIMLVVGALALVGKLSVGVVLLAAFLASGCSVFFSPAVSTLMIDIIPHNDMVRGQSIFSGVQTFVNLVGKALSGALVAFCGVPLIITLNGVSYLISAVTEMFITVPKTKHQGEAVTLRGVFSDFGNGLRAIGKNPLSADRHSLLPADKPFKRRRALAHAPLCHGKGLYRGYVWISYGSTDSGVFCMHQFAGNHSADAEAAIFCCKRRISDGYRFLCSVLFCQEFYLTLRAGVYRQFWKHSGQRHFQRLFVSCSAGG